MTLKHIGEILTGNLILDLSILAWAVAQILKVLIVLVKLYNSSAKNFIKGCFV